MGSNHTARILRWNLLHPFKWKSGFGCQQPNFNTFHFSCENNFAFSAMFVNFLEEFDEFDELDDMQKKYDLLRKLIDFQNDVKRCELIETQRFFLDISFDIPIACSLVTISVPGCSTKYVAYSVSPSPACLFCRRLFWLHPPSYLKWYWNLSSCSLSHPFSSFYHN